MTQYALDISLPVAYAPEQFIRSASNAHAYDLIMRWPNWPENSLYLFGEKGSGKTHLANIWKLRAKANFISVNSGSANNDFLPDSACIIDTIETWRDENFLFHLYNHCKSANIPLLITSALPPAKLDFILPDLLSRLKAMSFVEITAPDDDLLVALLCKQLADRQIKISPDVLNYMLPRLPRSFAAILELLDKLDKNSLSAGRSLTIPFLRKYL